MDRFVKRTETTYIVEDNASGIQAVSNESYEKAMDNLLRRIHRSDSLKEKVRVHEMLKNGLYITT